MKYAFLLLLAVLSCPARADDQVMNLFASQRQAHQDAMDTAAQNYEERGSDFVDNLYNNDSQTPFHPANDSTAPMPKPETATAAETANGKYVTGGPDLTVDTSQTDQEQTEQSDTSPQ